MENEKTKDLETRVMILESRVRDLCELMDESSLLHLHAARVLKEFTKRIITLENKLNSLN